MQRQERRRPKRLRKMIIVCALCAIVLSVSTYAWFIGMRSVRVSSFDVEIAAADSLMLSLNGEDWSNEIYISKATLGDVSYTGHTNSWGGTGLIPMSSVGDMDSDVSRMMLFEKSSFSVTRGGYRIMASRINNFNNINITDPEDDSKTISVLQPEQDGYVVFDLFVRNFSGTQYLTDLNEADEEAIYLTTDSKVSVAADGVANTGIENSVRVAFTQIGRVAGTNTDSDVITRMSCSDEKVDPSDDDSDVLITGICRNAQIWEPNDVHHNINAIRYYNTSCLKRVGDTVADSSYVTVGTDAEKKCKTVSEGTSYDTYAVRRAITSADAVDTYDGEHYNHYTKSDDEATDELHNYPYFTDTMKDLTGTRRPTFMTLAPNSITKLRVYIYIEGQDIDNYNFSAIGKKISVVFGFSKERFTAEDIEYSGPYLPTDIGACFGGSVPGTATACDAAYGSWYDDGDALTPNCSGVNKQYCDAIGGTFSPYGNCTDGEAPTTSEECTTAHGTWDEESTTCSGNTELYCDSIDGTYVATGECYQPQSPVDSSTDCGTAGGSWDETTSTCSGYTRAYCRAVEGTFKPGLVE